jgi:hypothetical protein
MGDIERLIRETIVESFTALERTTFILETYDRNRPCYCLIWIFDLPTNWTQSRRESYALSCMDLFNNVMSPEFPFFGPLMWISLFASSENEIEVIKSQVEMVRRNDQIAREKSYLFTHYLQNGFRCNCLKISFFHESAEKCRSIIERINQMYPGKFGLWSHDDRIVLILDNNWREDLQHSRLISVF